MHIPPSTFFLAQDTGKRYGAKDSMKLDRLNKTEKKHGLNKGKFIHKKKSINNIITVWCKHVH